VEPTDYRSVGSFLCNNCAILRSALVVSLVGATRFELATSASRTQKQKLKLFYINDLGKHVIQKRLPFC